LARPAPEPALSRPSLDWLASTEPAVRKSRGQYLTPRAVADALVERVPLWPGIKVLDPGVGTGELLAAVARREPAARLTGWDIDESALEAAAELVPEAGLVRRSALDPQGSPPGEGSGPFDLVIANPPYFQVRVTPELRRSFGEVISGRANAFALFFKAGLDLLEPGGRLAYIVPPSMNSGAYFEALREHIVSRARLSHLEILDGSAIFEGANTAAQLIVVELREPGDRPAGATAGSHPEGGTRAGGGAAHSRFVFEREQSEAGFRRVLFTPDADALRRDLEGRRSLWQLGYEAVTGSVVWNQRRDDLRQGPVDGCVPLIWSADLRGGVFDPRVRPPAPKPGWIEDPRPLRGPALLVNRVVGAVGRGEIRTARVPDGVEFLAENHVNLIRRRSGSRSLVDWDELEEMLRSEGLVDRVRMLTGNTQVSAGELTHLLPL
jgi:adenine-specific DNA-methyltransferase